VTIPKGVTSLQPTETSFFQALNISTKITKGNIEILSDVDLIKKGRKVMPGEAALLQKLGVKPFTYGLEILAVYDDGALFEPAVLDISESDLIAKFQSGINNVAAVSLAANYPTLAAVPHAFINGYKNVLSIALSTEYTFPLAKKVKDFLSDPEAMARAAAASAAPAAKGASSAAAAPAEPAAPAVVTDNTRRKLAERRKERIPLSQSIVDQFAAGRLYASITSRPGQCGRCDGYILEGEELNFYLRKMQKKKGKAQQ